MRNIFIYLLIITFIFSACDASKKLVEQGNKYYLSGNFDDAANYYYNALLINPKNVEAQQALRKSGNNVLTAKFSAFGKLIVENNAEEAVRQYIANKNYYKRVQSVGVELDWPTMYNEVYEDIKNEYISKQYDEGLSLIQDKKYDRAELIFTNIANIDSTYKDATVLRARSIIEPLYLNGIKMMDAQNYKEAYRNFNKVMAQDKAYKNTPALLQETLKKASVGVGILPVQNQTQSEGFDQKLYQQIMAELVKTKSPFLQIVDRSSLEKLLSEQQLGMSGIIDPESAAKAGRIIGLQFVLMTALSELQYESVGPQTDSIVAYQAFTETTTNSVSGLPQSVTRFKKVNYADTWQKRRVFYRVFYQLVSTQTAQVVASDVLTEEKNDESHQSFYKGDINSLYPLLPNGNYMPRVPLEFREQFNAVKQHVRSKEELMQEVCAVISQKLAEDIRIFIEK